MPNDDILIKSKGVAMVGSDRYKSGLHNKLDYHMLYIRD